VQAEISQVDTINTDRSRRQLNRSEQTLYETALASTRAADDSDPLARLDVE
jgi:hypothetical protein